jgi:hypothetical protein
MLPAYVNMASVWMDVGHRLTIKAGFDIDKNHAKLDVLVVAADELLKDGTKLAARAAHFTGDLISACVCEREREKRERERGREEERQKPSCFLISQQQQITQICM